MFLLLLTQSIYGSMEVSAQKVSVLSVTDNFKTILSRFYKHDSVSRDSS